MHTHIHHNNLAWFWSVDEYHFEDYSPIPQQVLSLEEAHGLEHASQMCHSDALLDSGEPIGESVMSKLSSSRHSWRHEKHNADPYSNLNKWVLRTLQNISLLATSLIWFCNLFHSLESFHRTLVCGLLAPTKENIIQIETFSLEYTFGSNCLYKLVLFHCVLWMCETGSCTDIGILQNASATGVKLL